MKSFTSTWRCQRPPVKPRHGPAAWPAKDAVAQLAEVATDAGVTLIELAIAFVTHHPAVTSAIIGPGTMEQLEGQIPSSDVTLTPETLDHIDAIVAPGVVLNPADTSYGEQVLKPVLRRR